MDFTVQIGKAFNISPFEIMDQDKDKVVMMINYYIEKGQNEPTQANTRDHMQTNTNERIRVNDKTATGGWF